MKKLYLIGGPMGVGKTSACGYLKQLLPQSVFLDGDWCWDADPFQVTEETKAMVMDNICHLLNNFIRCTAYEHVIFCWVMHRQEIIDGILARLETANVSQSSISANILETNRKQKQMQVGFGDFRALDLVEELRVLDVNSMTPMDALNALFQLREKARNI